VRELRLITFQICQDPIRCSDQTLNMRAFIIV
jgi:hypothetical protein